MKNATLHRRRNYFIKRVFQRNFIMKFCILVMIGSIISGTIIYISSKPTVTTTFENSRLMIKSTADYILPSILLSSAVVIVLIGLATIAVTLFTSHRIAGPLYRMQKDVEEVASGNLKKKFNLRKTDEIKALAESFEDMTRSLRADISSIKQSVSEAESSVEESDKVPLKVKEKLEDMKTLLDKFVT